MRTRAIGLLLLLLGATSVFSKDSSAALGSADVLRGHLRQMLKSGEHRQALAVVRSWMALSKDLPSGTRFRLLVLEARLEKLVGSEARASQILETARGVLRQSMKASADRGVNEAQLRALSLIEMLAWDQEQKISH